MRSRVAFSPPTDGYPYQPGAEEKAALWERSRFGAGQQPSLRALGFFEFFGEGGNDFEEVADDAVVGHFEDRSSCGSARA